MTAACPACAGLPADDVAADVARPSVALSVPDVHCAACIGKIERALNALPQVAHARVNLTLRRVTAQTDLPAEALVDELKRTGYEAFPFDASRLAHDTDATGSDLLLRLGVAGFAMMNVMLLSVAVWSGAADATRDLFHLISASIALPAVLYSAQPFFQSAAQSLKGFRLNMDVPISLAILLAAMMSLYEALHGGHHAYFDAALSLTFFLLIGRYLEHRTRASARSAAGELAALEVHTAERKSGTRVETVPIADLVVGDVLLVPTGARVPADGRLVSAEAVTDRSFLTGESEPVTHGKDADLRAGEVNLGAPFTLTATAVGDDTSLRQMAAMVETAENARNSYTSLADKAAQVYAPAVHILSALAFLGWYIGTGDLRLSLNIAIAVLIITCPCALGLAVPAVATAAIGKLYQLGFLVKSGTALERLAEVDTVFFDKTGTLTQPGFDFDLDTLSDDERAIALGLAHASKHPVARALAARLGQTTPALIEDISERAGRGVSGQVAGEEVRLGQAAWVGLDGGGLALKTGARAIALRQNETLRPGAAEAIAGVRASGLDVAMMTGDSATRAKRLAQDLGLSAFTPEMAPEDKHTMVEASEAEGHHVLMVGDGLNDTVALAAAHASVAPATALEAARSASDVVLVRDSLEDLPALIATSRAAVRLSRQNFTIATLYNAVAIPIALAGFATPMLAALAMSTSSLTVLINALRVRRAS